MRRTCIERLEARLLLATVLETELLPGAVHRADLNGYDLWHEFRFTAAAGETIPLFVGDTSITGIAGRSVVSQRPVFEVYGPGDALVATLTPGERNDIVAERTGTYRLAVRAEVAPTRYHFSWGTPLALNLTFTNEADSVEIRTEEDGKTIVRLTDRLAIFGRNDQAIVESLTLWLGDGDESR